MEPDYFKDMTPTIRKTQKVGIVLSTKLMEDFPCFKIKLQVNWQVREGASGKIKLSC